MGIASLRADADVDSDDVIIDDDDAFSVDSGVPVSFPDAPRGGHNARSATPHGGGGGNGRPRVKSADGSVIEMNYERGGGSDAGNHAGFRGGASSGNRDTESL